jgi:hypothetical protein
MIFPQSFERLVTRAIKSVKLYLYRELVVRACGTKALSCPEIIFFARLNSAKSAAQSLWKKKLASILCTFRTSTVVFGHYRGLGNFLQFLDKRGMGVHLCRKIMVQNYRLSDAGLRAASFVFLLKKMRFPHKYSSTVK